MWEDEANANGGKWVLTMKNNPQLLDRCWAWLAMALVGEDLDEGDEICGAVVSLRSKVDRIQLWIRSKEDVEKINGIGKKLVKLLDVSEADGIGLEFQVTLFVLVCSACADQRCSIIRTIVRHRISSCRYRHFPRLLTAARSTRSLDSRARSLLLPRLLLPTSNNRPVSLDLAAHSPTSASEAEALWADQDGEPSGSNRLFPYATIGMHVRIRPSESRTPKQLYNTCVTSCVTPGTV